MKKPCVGVLAVQGCVDAHKKHIKACNSIFKKIRFKEDFQNIDAIILPGGESSTQLRLISALEMEEEFINFINTHPVWGICAGSILLASSVFKPSQRSYNKIEMQIERNGYGRQISSFNQKINNFECAFIRAPIIREVSSDVEVIHRDDYNNPVFVRQGNYFASTFHPELSNKTPSPFHKTFIEATISTLQ